MAKVQVTNVTVLDNPSPFLNPFQFEVTFECFEDLPEGKCTVVCLPRSGQPINMIVRIAKWLSIRS